MYTNYLLQIQQSKLCSRDELLSKFPPINVETTNLLQKIEKQDIEKIIELFIYFTTMKSPRSIPINILNILQ